MENFVFYAKINMKNEKNKMNMKKLLAFLVLLVGVLFLASTVSAQQVVSGPVLVEVDGVDAALSPAIVIGESVTFRVEFESAVNASDITVKVEVEGEKKDVDAETR